MNLTLIGHADRYAVEQLQMALFPEGTEGDAVSTLHRGNTWLTASTKITIDGRTASASRRLKADREDVRLRRRALQQSYYLAAIQLLGYEPAWGALAGVRPTKISTKHMLRGGTAKSADKLHCGRGKSFGVRGHFSVCRHPLLPHPLYLLQFCQPHRRQKNRTFGALFGSSTPGDPCIRQAFGRIRPKNPHRLHWRRHPHHPLRSSDGPSSGHHPSFFRPVPVH